MRQTVSKNFRDEIIKIYPNCLIKNSYLRFLQYRLFSNNWEDQENCILKVPQFALAYCEDKIKALATNNYKGYLFLQKFSEEIQYITWSDWSFAEGRCRVVKFPIDERLEYLLTSETYKDYKKEGGRIYFISGTKFTTRNRNLKLKKAQEKLNNELDDIRKCRKVRKGAAKIFFYMMKVDIKHYRKIIDNNIDTVELAINNRIDLAETKKKVYLEIIDCLTEIKKPMLHGVKNSWRLYDEGVSITGLPRQYRKMLCKGWTEFDIKSSQLAIVSSKWNIPTIHKFLSERNSVWDLFFNVFPVSTNEYEDAKRFFKESLYSVVFGKAESSIAKDYDKIFGLGAGKKFSDIWLVRDLFDAREAEINKLANVPQGRYYSLVAGLTCNPNNFFKTGMSKGELKKFEETGVMPYTQRKRITSAMAQEIQMIEMAILTPIIDLAEKNSEYYVITLWQHDGFSVKFLDNSERDKYTNVIVNAFQSTIDSLKTFNIPTYLEYEHL